ncbi:hypothetical protein G7Y79_00007g022690 [Physcia stellaris]|nr:hypothetical protein G7Y79_00007g022690 [Physcia stellaris]
MNMAIPQSNNLWRFLGLLCVLPLGIADPTSTVQANSTRGAPSCFTLYSASDGAFWLYKRTNTACPLADKTLCPQSGWTEMLARDGLGEITLHSKVPGGQRVYVAPDGALKFTAANFPHPPHESSSGPFKVGFSTIAGRVVGGYILYFGKGSRPGGSQIIFCPTNEPPQVFNAGYRVTPLQAFVDIGALSDADVPLGSVADCIRWEVVTETYPALQASPPNAWEYV